MFDILFIFKEGREGRLLSFSLEPINMNSVLVIFSVNLFMVSQRFMLSKSPSGKTERNGYYHSNKPDRNHQHTFLAQSETGNTTLEGATF